MVFLITSGVVGLSKRHTVKQTAVESHLQSVPCLFKGHSLNSQRVCIFAFCCSASANRFNSLINGRSRNPAVQMSRSEFIWKKLGVFHTTSAALL